MSERSDNLKGELLEQIGKMQDENLRIVLLLIHSTFEQSLAEIGAISKKIDDLKSDEAALQAAVLNGLAPHHKADHDWLHEHRRLTESTLPLIERCEPCIEWVEKKMREEEDARVNAKSRWEKFLEIAMDKGVTIALGAAAALAGVKWL